jgi:transmembrane sensor
MFEQYQHFRAEDFVQDDAFIQWIKNPDAECDAFWQRFLAHCPEQRDQVERARRMVSALAAASSAPYPVEDAALIWNGVVSHLPKQGMWANTLLRPRTFFRWAVAASFLMALAALGVWAARSGFDAKASYAGPANRAVEQGEKEIFNPERRSQNIQLPDGSRVILMPQGKIRFSKQFAGAAREVFLDGTAFFEVTPDAEKPFFVYSGTLVTKVLGTSFWVRANPGEEKFVVSVRTGRVSVFTNGKNRSRPAGEPELVLTPNQQIVFDLENESFAQTLVEKPALLIQPEELPEFEFRDAPVDRIFSAIARAYGVTIVFDEKIFGSCTLTTSLTKETLFEKLEVVCKATASNYKVEGNQVIISGKGCD